MAIDYLGFDFTGPQDEISEADAVNCFFIKGDRHDKDRVELQFGFDGTFRGSAKHFEYDVDVVVFVPKTLGLFENESVSQLRHEFQSYVRLHTHVSDPNNDSSLVRVRESLQRFKRELSDANLRSFAIELEGFLKAQRKTIRKHIKLISSDQHIISQVLLEIESVSYLLDEFREILLRRDLHGKKADDLIRGSINHDLLLLNEYVSHVYIQHLGELYLTCAQIEKSDVVQRKLLEHCFLETTVRKNYGFLIVDPDLGHPNQSNQFLQEIYLRRISLLKKYFQKSLFVQVTGESSESRLYLPNMATSAALAAAFVIMVQLYQTKSLADRVGVNSVAFLAVGVLAYVIKDILKDSMRRSFIKRSGRWFADFHKKLFIRRDGTKKQLGMIREYINTKDSGKLPIDLRKLRYSDVGGDLEEYLHEDVLHFKKRVTLDLDGLGQKKDEPWGLREIVRYRFDRLLTNMEDAFKKMHVVNSNGVPSTRLGHRLYRIHIATWINKQNKTQGELPVQPVFRAFRVTLDKTGVLFVENMPWSDLHGMPSAPE